MNILSPSIFDSTFAGWTTTTTGAGTVNVAADKKTITCSAATADRGFVRYNMLAPGGSQVILKVWAKNTQAFAGNAQIIIDSPSGTARASDKVDSTSWKQYKLAINVPVQKELAEVSFVLGATTTANGSGSFTKPEIEVIGSSIGAPRLLACAMVDMTTAAITLNANYLRQGVSAVAWDSVNKEIVVTLSADYSVLASGTALGYRPLILLTPSPDSYGASNLPVMWTAGKWFTAGSNQFSIVGFLPSGSKFDMALIAGGGTPHMYVSFQVFG